MSAAKDWHNAVFVRAENVIRRDVAGETVLVPVAPSGAADLECLYRMNAVGAAVWDALDGRTPVSAVVERIASSFGPSTDASGPDGPQPQEIEEDVRSFLGDLEEAGLAERRMSQEAAPDNKQE
ncbi:MAG TPA: PqqD family protein [Sumerlaeia bacterium]|nr:PqqD family protein [Sumerlaeia bacterium]